MKGADADIRGVFTVIALQRRHLVAVVLVYALGVIYSSLVLGPIGLHFVAFSLGDVWQKILAIRFVPHASDQRPDWIANLTMMVPLGFLVMAVLCWRRGWNAARLGAVTAFLICAAFILAVKFAQLYFPPRTVSLNYITAQMLGALGGIVLYRLTLSRLYPRLVRLFDKGDGLVILFGAYTVWLILYFLMPFDFTFGLGDLLIRAIELPDIIAGFPGAGRPFMDRLLFVVGDTVAMIPVGMFLAVTARGRSMRSQLWRGFVIVLVVEILTLFVLSATPFAVAILYRMAGIWLGLRFIRGIHGKDLRKRHYAFSRFVPAAFTLYVFLLLLANDVLTSRWVTLDQAVNALEARQFLPFWNFYIVSKAQATQSLVAHLAMFAPVGVMIWVRRGFWSNGAAFSAMVAFLLSLVIELGRWMKPGLRPDFSDPLLAALGAAIAFKAMPYLWRMFEREATMGAPVDDLVAARERNPAGTAPGVPPVARA
jgi:glycopeptide antibiotics resistance protein